MRALWTRLIAFQSDHPGCEAWTRTAATLVAEAGGEVLGLSVLPPAVHRAFMDTDLDTVLTARLTGAQDRHVAARRERFEAALAATGGRGRLVAVTGDEATAARRWARLADAVVIGHPGSEAGSLDDEARIIGHLLLGGGRPVVVTPPDWSGGPLDTRTVLIAWDGSREAARALSDALPLLTGGRVVLLHIASADRVRPVEEQDLQELAAYLSGKGLDVTLRETAAGRQPVGTVLLDEQEACGAGLLVMGGYGHSRLRELVLGGATRQVLAHMRRPVLLAH